MIHHIVLLRVPESNTARVKTAIEGIAELNLSGFKGLVSSANLSPEQRKQGFNLGFIALFETWEALARYQSHEDHKKQGAELLAALANPDDDLLVFDLEQNASMST